MSFYLQVLSTENIDSSACIAIFTDSHRVLINCGEGIQRLCVEHKVRLSKIRALLFTDFAPQNVFGLPGLALTVADAGNSNIRVAGPSELKQFIHTTRHFMKLPEGLLKFHDVEQSGNRKDSVSTVFNSSELDICMLSFNLPSSDVDTAVNTTTSTNCNSNHTSNISHNINNVEHSVNNIHTSGCLQRNCFIVRTPELKGKFDIKKAQSLKVPKGPLFGEYVFVNWSCRMHILVSFRSESHKTFYSALICLSY
jgi:ribonuclease Z